MNLPTAPVRLAISTCPNDTFAFHAILENKIDLRGIEFDIQLMDIRELNQGLFRGDFDVAKGSFHAAAALSDELIVLPSGSALGFGVGPMLLAANPDDEPGKNAGSTTLCPGEHTTANMLFKIFYAEAIRQRRVTVEHRVFSEIMPALKNREVEFGVCIHEGRFTWQEQGLHKVADLGSVWESRTGSPLPLGGIFARRSLESSRIQRVQSVICESIRYGLDNRADTLITMRQYAQEFSDDVLFGHVDLYVNDWTVALGETGRRALKVLSEQARAAGLIKPDANEIEVWQG